MYDRSVPHQFRQVDFVFKDDACVLYSCFHKSPNAEMISMGIWPSAFAQAQGDFDVCTSVDLADQKNPPFTRQAHLDWESNAMSSV